MRFLDALFGKRRDEHDTVEATPAWHACELDVLETRRMLDAQPLNLGVTFTEQDAGSDLLPDQFEVTFSGGADGTQLTELVIDGDIDGNGLDEGDIVFHVGPDGPGSDKYHPFQVVSMTGNGTVTAEVSEDGLRLTLRFEGFNAGDRLIFSIDTDEVLINKLPGVIITDPEELYDPIVSGAEFNNVILSATFSAPHYHDVSGDGRFKNFYDPQLIESGLDLPADNHNGQRDRTAGGFLQMQQRPLPIAISGHVYHDRDFDQSWDAGEEGIAGSKLTLYKLNEQTGQYELVTRNGQAVTTTTDANGRYEFGTNLELDPGTYRIVQTQPSAYEVSTGAQAGTVEGQTQGRVIGADFNTITDVNIAKGGTQSINNNFGEANLASLSGHVFHDANDNGIRDAGEQPIANVTIRIVPVNTAVPQQIVTVTTDANGYYYVEGLIPGTYRIEQVQPAGWLDGKDSLGSVDGRSNGVLGNDVMSGVVLVSGSSGINYDFGELLPVEIHGTVTARVGPGDCFDPATPKVPIAGVLIELFDQNGNLLAQTRTDANGKYSFTGLRPGVYAIYEHQPVGYFDGGERAGNVGGQTRGQVTSNDRITGINLTSGEVSRGNDFCEAVPGKISGNVWADYNDDCTFNEGDIPLSGVRIDLLDQQGNLVATTTTNAAGYYEFANLPEGVYTVVEHQPAGYFDGATKAGSGGGVATNNRISQIGVHAGANFVNYDFCEKPPSSISGRVFSDLNGDCTFNAGDVPLAGVQIDLFDGNGNLIATTYTDANGEYKFDNLRSGVYTVFEHQPAGYLQGATKVGSGGGTVLGQDRIGGIALGPGAALVNYDFCEKLPSSISGKVWVDLNGDRAHNPGETLLEGVRIDLFDGNGNLIGTTYTDANGYYEFTNLYAGTYTVYEHQPVGYLQGGTMAGSGGGIVQGDRISSIVMGTGVNLINYDFCEEIPSSISGHVWEDMLGNSLLEPGDPRLAGVRIDLFDGNGNLVGTTYTDANGYYQFTNLARGYYTVYEHQPTGYLQGGTIAGSGGGVVAGDRIGVQIGAGVNLVNYDFWEYRPSTLAGYVYQDGGIIITPDGLPPSDLTGIRDGLRTPDDTPIAGVRIDLYDEAGNLVATTTTDAQGRYRFENLRPGVYTLVEHQPNGFYDGIDHAGTHGGTVTNDRISAIGLVSGSNADEYNFSEIQIATGVIPPPPRQDPDVRPDPVAPPMLSEERPFIGTPMLPTPETPIDPYIATPDYTWHLSLLDAGTPRGDEGGANTFVSVSLRADESWEETEVLRRGRWTLVDSDEGLVEAQPGRTLVFGLRGGIPIVGDFNGDGRSNVGIYKDGEWFIDINGNGVWDEGDLWARLGDENSLPVVGDWDGDGKDDIGIYGRAWNGDQVAINAEPGLPAAANRYVGGRAKNAPPTPDQATSGERLLQAGRRGELRADLIDHVFAFGGQADVPVAGDWNGDGVSTIGTFRGGQWQLDLDGDGRFTGSDESFTFGQPGDRAVVGDWNGDGVKQIGVYRNGTWILDTNGNRTLDAEDRVFEMGGPGDLPVVGDWNGDGIDEPGVYTAGS